MTQTGTWADAAYKPEAVDRDNPSAQAYQRVTESLSPSG